MESFNENSNFLLNIEKNNNIFINNIIINEDDNKDKNFIINDLFTLFRSKIHFLNEIDKNITDKNNNQNPKDKNIENKDKDKDKENNNNHNNIENNKYLCSKETNNQEVDKDLDIDYPNAIKNNPEFFQEIKKSIAELINENNYNKYFNFDKNNNNKDKKFYGYFQENIILDFLKNLQKFFLEKKFPFVFEELKYFEVNINF
jgi:hypothetical protein